MKRSRKVVLLITGSVLLTACQRSDSQTSGQASNGTNSPAANTGTHGGGSAVSGSRTYYPWYHPGRYFGWSDSSSSSSKSRIGQQGGGTGSESGAHGSATRGGFGSHSSSAS